MQLQFIYIHYLFKCVAVVRSFKAASKYEKQNKNISTILELELHNNAIISGMIHSPLTAPNTAEWP